ncbi:MAG: Ig-like domain-containing protein [Halofilum sp. (in: g-proteobacteria)]|nr:Ig-like domain-containing protein [Halofilum sp. (in: g-proteobacteria)]
MAWAVVAQLSLMLSACGGGGGDSDDNDGNGTPDAADDSFSLDAGTASTLDVLANDDFGDDGAGDSAIFIVSGPASGTATVDEDDSPNNPIDDTIEYTPDTGFSGSDSFVYRIEDSDGDTDTATVSITVNAGEHSRRRRQRHGTGEQRRINGRCAGQRPVRNRRPGGRRHRRLDAAHRTVRRSSTTTGRRAIQPTTPIDLHAGRRVQRQRQLHLHDQGCQRRH